MSKVVAFADALDQRGYTIVPNALLLDEGLTANARMTWAVLAFYARESDEAWPGQERLGERIGLSERHLRRAVRDLEAAGWLATQRRGLGKTNLYRLTVPSALDRTPASGQDRTPASDPSGHPRPISSTQRKKDAEEVSEDALAVHAYYCEKRGIQRRLAPGTAKLITRARNAGFEVNDLKIAVDGLLGSDWHQQHGQLTLSTIFKTGPGTESFEDRIQGFIDRALRNQPTGMAVNVPEWVKKNLRVARESPDDTQAVAMGRSATEWLTQRGLEAGYSADGRITITRIDT